MFFKQCKKECFLKNNIYESLNRYTNKFNANRTIKLYSFIIHYTFSNLKYQVIIVKKIYGMPTRTRLQKEKEKKLLKQ